MLLQLFRTSFSCSFTTRNIWMMRYVGNLLVLISLFFVLMVILSDISKINIPSSYCIPSLCKWLYNSIYFSWFMTLSQIKIIYLQIPLYIIYHIYSVLCKKLFFLPSYTGLSCEFDKSIVYVGVIDAIFVIIFVLLLTLSVWLLYQ